MKKLAVIKLGGSAITIKDKPLTPKEKVIDSIASELANMHREYDFIIVHGAGSFGHPQAKKYRLNEGYLGAWQFKGLTETKLAVEQLSLIIMSRFIRQGLTLFPIHPSSIAMNIGGKLAYFNNNTVKQVLKVGLIPLLHGDVVFDEKLVFSILSGDTIASHLAISLGAELLIYGVNVDGIYDKDPERFPNAKLLKTLSMKDLDHIDISKKARVDVTGGIRRKLEDAFNAVKKGIKVIIANITIPGNLTLILKGELPERCTLLVP